MLADAGLEVVAASPVRVDGRTVAVLLAARHARRRVDALDREALELAAQAGSALANTRQFTDQRALTEELAETSRRDPLTGLGNRRHAAGLLSDLRPGDGVLLFDLDQFKQVNDSDGHAAGEASVDVAERLNQGWRATSPRTTVSTGVAVHQPGDDPAATLARADAALYQAKRTGRDRVHANLVPSA